MNTNPNTPTRPEDGIDRTVGAYFRSEMPNPWPAAPRPWAEKATLSTPATHSASRSRWALAASVAILVGGCWYLSGHLTDGRKRPDTNFNGTADLKHAKDAGKNLPKTP
jgi:hypothetical protein